MTEDDMGKIDISLFDESCLHQFQEKMLIIFSTCLGFRGSREHTYFKRCQVGSGFFPSNHPTYPGYEWWGLVEFSSDKTHKLSLSHHHVRDTHEGVGKFPVLSDGTSGPVAKDAGGAIKRYCALLDKGLPPSEKDNRRFYRKVKASGLEYCPLYALGKDSIRALFQSGFRRMGIINWETLRPHSGRGVFITAMANDPTVPVQYGVAAARHSDATTFMGYATNGITGGANVLRAVLNTVSGSGAATRKKPEEVEVAEQDEQEEQKNFEMLVVDGEEEAAKSSDSSDDVLVVGRKKNDAAAQGRKEEAMQTAVTPLGARRNVLCPDEVTVTSQLTESAATVTTSLPNQRRFMSSHASLSNENQSYKTAVENPANDKKYSVYTQFQLDELDSELSRFENSRRMNPPPHEVTPSERPVFFQGSAQSIGGNSFTQQEEEPRKPSVREMEIIRMRERLNDIEHQERLRYRQEREMDNITRFDSYPYWDSADEIRSLYLDSLEEDGMGSSREDFIRRRRREARKARNRGRRSRSFYKH
jgi:hypothetical protein